MMTLRVCDDVFKGWINLDTRQLVQRHVNTQVPNTKISASQNLSRFYHHFSRFSFPFLLSLQWQPSHIMVIKKEQNNITVKQLNTYLVKHRRYVKCTLPPPVQERAALSREKLCSPLVLHSADHGILRRVEESSILLYTYGHLDNRGHTKIQARIRPTLQWKKGRVRYGWGWGVPGWVGVKVLKRLGRVRFLPGTLTDIHQAAHF